MFMYLPFLIALLAVISVVCGRKKTGYALWLVLCLVTIAWFNYHASDTLNLSF
jgi:hypothetical protein